MTDAAPATNSSSTDAPTTAETNMQLVTFKLVGETFSLPILDVREVIHMSDVTPVPNAPLFVEGVLNLRGQILPVVDLRKRFSLPPAETTAETRIIVVEIGTSVLGLIVDEVQEILRVSADSVAPPPAIVAKGIGSEYLRGITYVEDKMVILVDMRRVFSKEEVESMVG